MRSLRHKTAKLLILLTMPIALTAPLAHGKSGGGGSDGGGSLALDAHGNRALLDFFNFAPELVQAPSAAGKKIRVTPSLRHLGIDTVSIKNLGYEETLLTKARAMENSSPVFASRLAQAIRNMKVFIVDYDFGKALDQKEKELIINPAVTKTTPLAVYVKDHGVFLRRAEFERLNQNNQEALLIHEAIRHMQLSYSFDISDKKLQDLTVRTFKGTDLDKSVDTREFLGESAVRSEKQYEIANELAKVSSRILRLRLMNQEQFNESALLDLEKIENSLDGLVVQIRSQGVPLDLSDRLLKLAGDFTPFKEKYLSLSTSHKFWQDLWQLELDTRMIIDTVLLHGLTDTLDNAKDSAIALKNIFGLELITKEINENGWWNSEYKGVGLEAVEKMQQLGIIREEEKASTQSDSDDQPEGSTASAR